MSHVADKIIRILHECHPNKDDFENKTKDSSESKESRKKIEKEKLEKIKSDADKFFADTRCNYIASVEYASLNKMLALCNLEIGNEITAIHHLVEAHAVILRQHILHRYQKTHVRESVWNEPQIYGLRPTHVKFETKFTDNNEALKTKLLNLPKEWYMIQVTAQYESPTILRYKKRTSNVMHAVHITILPTGMSDIEPLCITVPRPATQVSYDICEEIQKLLDDYTSVLKTTYTNHKQYWMMRADQNNKMKIAINGLENVWLREWRVLFMADPIEDLEMVNEIHQMIDKLISDFKSPNEISKRCKWLLKKVSIGAGFLTREEIARAIKFLLPEHEKLANNIILSIYGKLPYIKNLENTKRQTLVLIIDEWKSCYNAQPGEEMSEALINRDILMYTGHGNGIEYLSGEDIERMRVKSTVLLFGCSSVKLLVIGGRYPPYGVSNQYLIACSPCLLGMLWEVTDADIDKMTTNFMSTWIPSSSKKSWAEVDMDSWSSGTLKFTKNGAKDKTKMYEPEMLRAVAKSKNSCSHYMTAAAIVVRGLPIKIV
ncbi:uncharacterized protein Sse isoform X2 [Temnothorax longispinosus]|uniref:uncharacterized protein Sse isoform X2 n=1 Tax=Temnothorax longispinosus TaxID=300112 RepID=UPI003A99C2D6